MRKTLPQLLRTIRACTHCVNALPCVPRPVLQAHRSARLRIVGQAPGRKVHETGIPWNDPSGDRLRHWLGLTPEQFYDPHKVAIIPMGFCYPGKAISGDNPPRPECAPRWHEKLMHLCLTSRLPCSWDSMRRLIILVIAVKPRFAILLKHGRSICRWGIFRWRIRLRATSRGSLEIRGSKMSWCRSFKT